MPGVLDRGCKPARRALEQEDGGAPGAYWFLPTSVPQAPLPLSKTGNVPDCCVPGDPWAHLSLRL